MSSPASPIVRSFPLPPPAFASQNVLLRPRLSRLALTALIAAFLCPLLGFALGVGASHAIDSARGRLTGKALAVVAVTISVANFVIGCLIIMGSAPR